MIASAHITGKPGAARGRLIALEGTGGRGMAVAVRRLERSFRQAKASAGVSGWDASGIFFEIAFGPVEPVRAFDAHRLRISAAAERVDAGLLCGDG